MAPHLIPTEGHVVGLVDLGTNSVRLLVVRINTNRSYTILNQHKVMVRLGEGEFVKQRLRQEAMERTILVLRRFADMARNLGAEEIYAVATSATRDAENRDVFIERVRKEADIDLKVISGDHPVTVGAVVQVSVVPPRSSVTSFPLFQKVAVESAYRAPDADVT